MFSHLILGLLRDGHGRHGYELMTEYLTRSGKHLSAGNFYRELARLTSDGLLRTGVNPPNADARRIPYQITARGADVFDDWMLAPSSLDDDLSTWLLFVDRLSPATRNELLDRLQESLWVQSKKLVRSREDALRQRRSPEGNRRWDPLPALITLRMKKISAELEFLAEFREEFERQQRTAPQAARPTIEPPPDRLPATSTVRAARNQAR
jgi:DNA-binding PadR family transcriptional regulator